MVRSWLFLIYSIRKQAKKDHKLKEYRSYWLVKKRKRILKSVREELSVLEQKLDDDIFS